MKEERISLWTICLPLIVFYGIQMLVSVFMSEIYIVYDMASYKSGGMNSLLSAYYSLVSSNTFLSISYMLVSLISIPVFFIWYKRVVLDVSNVKVSKLICLHKRLNWKFIPGCILGFLGINIVSNYVTIISSKLWPSLYMEYEKLIANYGLTGFSKTTLLVYLYAVILGPIAEELCFRGLTFGFLKKNMNFWVANVIQALIFGVVHGNVIQGVYAFIFGLFLGYIYYHTENIFVPIMFHICFNLFGTSDIVNKFSLNIYIYMLVLLLGFIAIYFGAMLIAKSKKEIKK